MVQFTQLPHPDVLHSAGPQSARDGSSRAGEPGRSALRFSLPSWGGAPTTERQLQLLLSAWCILLYRYSEQDEFTVEVFSRLDGDYAQSLDLRLQGDTTAAQTLGQVAELLSSAQQYPPSTRTRQALGFSLGSLSQPAARFEAQDPRCGELHLVATLRQGDPSSEIECEIAYDSTRRGAEVIERMSRQYRVLLAALESRPESAVRSFPLLDEQEQAAQRSEWSGAVFSGPFVSVLRNIERHAAERPDAIAITLNTQTLSYSELNCQANRLARWLREQGLRPGGNVAVSMEPCLEFLVSMLGILKAGGTHVPLDPSYPPERLKVIVEDTRPLIVLTQLGLVPRLEPIAPRLCAVNEAEPELANFDDTDLGLEIDPEQTAYIVYTSGTTGKPKGVLISHAALSHYIAVAASAYGYDSRDVIPAVARFSFSITFFELLSPLVAGGTLILLERNHVLDLQRMVKTLEEATCIHCSPSLWRKIIAYIDEQQIASETFGKLRHVSSGGDMVPPDLLESLKRIFVQAEVFVIYGCSEISCMGCTYAVPRHRKLTSTRVGKPFPNMVLRLLDPDRNLVPPGVIGEVCFGGQGLAKGYLNAPELTDKKFIEIAGERLYQTGDLGRVEQ